MGHRTLTSCSCSYPSIAAGLIPRNSYSPRLKFGSGPQFNIGVATLHASSAITLQPTAEPQSSSPPV
ncbi:hypothetical protein CPB84DRAFT_1800981 [Gymnopilus junonius]|uniref:Uncharacterized protein n=1 Tax=Gymnopilus junonius TaxID=109634 RepID=A0A9P5N779_GYMJU|nr:hypothetical protein CPB84DRAFT_1800981 [Gymnopilus junonius]